MSSYESTSQTVNSFPLHAIKKSGYSYDANGNLVSPAGGRKDADLELLKPAQRHQRGWVADRKLSHDQDGLRVKKVSNSVATYYVNQYYEVSGARVTKYYDSGGQRVAMKQGTVLTYLHSDYLGSTVLETVGNSATADQKYYAYGKQRDTGPVVTAPNRAPKVYGHRSKMARGCSIIPPGEKGVRSVCAPPLNFRSLALYSADTSAFANSSHVVALPSAGLTRVLSWARVQVRRRSSTTDGIVPKQCFKISSSVSTLSTSLCTWLIPFAVSLLLFDVVFVAIWQPHCHTHPSFRRSDGRAPHPHIHRGLE